MSLILTTTELTITFLFLISLNGFFCFFKMPILAFPIAIFSTIFLIGFRINFSGQTIIFSMILLILIVANFWLNLQDYKK